MVSTRSRTNKAEKGDAGASSEKLSSSPPSSESSKRKVQPKTAHKESSERKDGDDEDEDDNTSSKKTKLTTVSVGEICKEGIQVLTHEGTPLKLSDLYADKGVVIFMYPKANTPGCTKQATGFNDNYEKIQAAGFEVYGLSADSPAALTKWKEKYNFNFSFLSDKNLDLIGYLGSKKEEAKIHRSHVIIEKGGKVLDIQCPISPAESFTQAIKFVTDLA